MPLRFRAKAIGIAALELPAIALITVGSLGMVQAALTLADRWDVPDVVVGMVILAWLTSLPNAFTAFRLGPLRPRPTRSSARRSTRTASTWPAGSSCLRCS